MVIEEAEASDEGLGGAGWVAETAEEPRDRGGGGGRGSRGHGLEVSPSSLLDQMVADGDLVAGAGGGGRGGGVDGGVGRREHVPEGCVGGGSERGLEGGKIQAGGAQRWRRCFPGKFAWRDGGDRVAAVEGWCDGGGSGVAHSSTRITRWK